uniref:Ceramide synthase 4 n=1 Tax=Macaca fascicularis TaxID=9541 RepID=A0A7N9D429_MACFA
MRRRGQAPGDPAPAQGPAPPSSPPAPGPAPPGPQPSARPHRSGARARPGPTPAAPPRPPPTQAFFSPAGAEARPGAESGCLERALRACSCSGYPARRAVPSPAAGSRCVLPPAPPGAAAVNKHRSGAAGLTRSLIQCTWAPAGPARRGGRGSEDLHYLLFQLTHCQQRFIGLPLSQWLGVRDQTRRQVKPNATLEKHFLTEGHRPKEPQLSLLAARCGLTLRQTQRWFRRRRKQDRPQLTKKFCEASWRFLFYLSSFVGGLSVLYHESWLWAPVMCWENYPNQTLKPSLYWWYLLELAFYLSLLIRLPFDVKRKDFKEQVIHHFVVVILMTFSYSANLLRIGSLVLLLHDSADYLLEACKMVNYTQYQHVCDALFLIFSLVFFYTRLVLFPTQILYTTYYESLGNRGPFFGYYFCNGLLMLLQLLHVFWSCLILRMLCSFIKKGQMEKDIRSDVEESDSSEEEEAGAQEPLQLKNGAARGPRPAPTDGLRSRVAGRLTRHTTAT